MNEELCLKLNPLIRGLRAYHRHEVKGLENIPKRKAAIVAHTHSLATYDMLLLMSAVFEATSRFPRSLIDRLFYKVPGVGSLMEALGSVCGDQENARSLLSNGELLFLAPGGMQESLRPRERKYKIYWQKRKGFARLAIETGSPVILAACPDADNIYDVYDNKITRMMYQKLKIPFFFARGLGPTALPKPVKLVHVLSEPIYPPLAPHPGTTEKLVDDFHQRLTREMEKLIRRALSYSKEYALIQ